MKSVHLTQSIRTSSNRRYNQGNHTSFKKRSKEMLWDDIPLSKNNPFSQQLSPWNQNAKMQTSINLLHTQIQKSADKIQKHLNNQASLVQIVLPVSKQYKNLSFQDSSLQSVPHKYFYPKLKINSNEVIVSNGQIQPKRKLKMIKKNSISSQKQVKKIVNLKMEWDQDIVYNPQRKHFEEQNLKRKILKEFSYTKPFQINPQKYSRQFKHEPRVIKSQFRNNRICHKELSGFQYKKYQIIRQIQKSNHFADYQQNQQKNVIKIDAQDHLNLDGHQDQLNQTNYRTISPTQHIAQIDEFQCASRSQKWKFRTSLRAKRTISPQKIKISTYKTINTIKQKVCQSVNTNSKNQIELIDKIALEPKLKNNFPLQIFTKTSPHFFKKTIS